MAHNHPIYRYMDDVAHAMAIEHGWAPLHDMVDHDTWMSPNGGLYKATGHYDPEFVSFWEKR